MEDRVDRDNDNRGSRPGSRAWVYFTGIALVLALVAPMVIMVLGDYAPAEIVDQQSQQLNKLDQRATDLANIVEAMKGGDVKELQQVVLALSEQVQELQRQLQQVDTSKVKQEVEDALNFRPWKELDETRQTAERELAEASVNITNWEDRLARFEKSQEANALASDANLLGEYQLIVSSATESAVTINSLSDDLRDLAVPVEKAITLGYMDVPPPAELVSRITEIRDEAGRLRRKYRDNLQELDSLLRRAPGDVPEDGLKLEAALAELAEQRAEIRREEVRVRVEDEQQKIVEELAELRLAGDRRVSEAEKERDKRIADAKVEAARLVGESEATLIATSARAVADEAGRQAELKAQKSAEEQLNHEYQLARPDIHRYLGPFIRDGYAQAHGHMNRQGATKGKMSLSAVRAAKALEPTREGQEALARIGSIQNDRYRNDFPYYIGGETGWQMIDKEWLRRAQELLSKFGDLMVKEGLLSP